MITSDYGRSASDTPHLRHQPAQLRARCAQRDVVASVRSLAPANRYAPSPHRRCAQAPTPINFVDPAILSLDPQTNEVG